MNAARLIEYGLLACAVIAILFVALATAYDFRRLYREPAIRARMRKLTNIRQPHVTIIVRITDSAGIPACLKSITESQYHKYDIVVALDSHASREVKRDVRAAIAQAPYPKNLIRTYCARRSQTEEMLLRRAYARSYRGEFVICLDASQTLDPFTIKRAVAYLYIRTASAGVVLGERIETVSSLGELVRTLAVLSRKLLTKPIEIVGLYRTRNLSGGVYRSAIVFQIHRTRTIRTDYESGTLIGGMTTKPATWIRALGFVGSILFLGVAIYSALLAATLQTTVPLWTSWSILVLWFIAAIWFDDTIRIRNKVGLTATLPMSYFAIVGTMFIGGIARMIRRSMF